MTSKICKGCKQLKSLGDYYSHPTCKGGVRSKCKSCVIKESQEFNLNHKDMRAKIARKQRKKFPWYYTWITIKARCNNPKNNHYEWYGGRGIKVLIEVEELKALWFLDQAYLMKKPSIDRINPDGNYEALNCRYIEMSDNSKWRFMARR